MSMVLFDAMGVCKSTCINPVLHSCVEVKCPQKRDQAAFLELEYAQLVKRTLLSSGKRESD